jgi:hypothetical protein
MSKKFLTTIKLVNLASAPNSGQTGELYYDSTHNVIKYYNGSSWVAPSGSSLTVQQTDSNGNPTTSYSNISTLQFDGGSGFVVTDPATGVAKISLNSTFKYWEINGELGLTAEGEDTINFIAGEGINLSAEITNGRKNLTIANVSPSGYLPVYSGEPSNPVAGQIYFDSGLKTVKAYNGIAWYQVGGPHVVTDHIHSYDGNVSKVIDGQYVYAILNLDGGYSSTLSFAGQAYDGGNSATVSFFDIINDSGGSII